jgi:MFS family permease
MHTADTPAIEPGEPPIAGGPEKAKPKRTPLGASYRKVFTASVVSNLGDGVSTVAYPWLASAITRNPILIACVMVAQRLPWLVFTLPAGVITDRVDRRRAMVLMDGCRCVLTGLVALAVLSQQSDLPAPDEIDQVVHTEWFLYLAVVVATLLLGMAEVLRDNSAQTILPAIVDAENLERANGRMWSAEGVTNTFIGPPLGSLLIAVAFALPFLLDAVSFFAAAALVATIPGSFRATRPEGQEPAHWRADLKEGVRWLWSHELLRPMAIILGLMNAAGMVSLGTFVLFAQEVLDIGPALFAVVGMGGAVGGIVGGSFASYFSKRFGSGTCLAMVLAVSAAMAYLMAVNSWWPIAFVLFGVGTLVGMLWNVITVSLRQTIIPPHLLGRVNSVYRFFAWGMMPIGAAIGGLVVVIVDAFASRAMALRATWIVNGLVYTALFVVGRAKLTTAKLEAARAAASTS